MKSEGEPNVGHNEYQQLLPVYEVPSRDIVALGERILHDVRNLQEREMNYSEGHGFPALHNTLNPM